MEQIYQTIVDQMFLEAYEDRPPDGFFHPSTLSGCDRLAVYETSGTEPTDPKDIRNIRIMGNGTSVHERIQQFVKEEGWPLEVKIEWGPIRGSADILRPVGHDNDHDGNVWTIYELNELKSISPMGKKFLKGQPKEEHVLQDRIYHAALRNMGYHLSPIIRFVYIDRDDWSVTEFEERAWTEAEESDFLDGLDSLVVHLEEGTLPDRKPKDYWLCRYCPFRTRCWDVDKENERNGD